MLKPKDGQYLSLHFLIYFDTATTSKGCRQMLRKGSHNWTLNQFITFIIKNFNDPYAGSPTKTLLRLLLPLNDQAWVSSQASSMLAHEQGPIRESR